ncbi:putative transporter [Pseudomonas aeruginosa]|nr:putative transporter [Pseudomonas aeruginosa]
MFAQNNGVIQLTGVASRYVGLWIAAMLVLLGLFPSVAGVIQAVPEPVLGGAAMVMFGAVAASGINILAGIQLDRRALLIIAVSLALGLGVSQVPEFLAHMPAALRNVLESGVATGGICALLLNWFLPERPGPEGRTLIGAAPPPGGVAVFAEGFSYPANWLGMIDGMAMPVGHPLPSRNPDPRPCPSPAARCASA